MSTTNSQSKVSAPVAATGKAGRWTPLGVCLLSALVFGFWLLRQEAAPVGSDMLIASAALEGFATALREGILYPRWVDNMLRGLGIPFFVFYPPLIYYFLAFVVLLTGSKVLAFKLLAFVVAGLASGGMYLFVRCWSERPGALLSAFLYPLLPYFVLDYYYRSAMAELWAFVWFPLILAALHKILKKGGQHRFVILAFCFSALYVTHLLSAEMFLPLYALYALLLSHRKPWRLLAAYVAPLAGAFPVAIYLLPVLTERRLVLFDTLTKGLVDYRRNFLFVDEVALGFTMAEIKMFVTPAAVGTVALALLAFALIGAGKKELPKGEYPALGSLVVGAVAGFIMTTPLSRVLWNTIPPLAYLQFPWRFCSVITLVAASLVGPGLWMGLRKRGTPAFLRIAGVLAVVLTLYMVGLGQRVALGRPYGYNENMAGNQFMNSSSVEEYTPATVRARTHALAFWTPAIKQLRGPEIQPAFRKGSGVSSVRVLDWKASHRRLQINSTDRGNFIQLRTFDYPGWTVRVNEEILPHKTHSESGAIQFKTRPGTHVYDIRFETTGLRTTGAYVSLVSTGLMILVGARRKRLKKLGQSPFSPEIGDCP